MSVNYHAYQSRGVLFGECEKVCGQWREEFTGYDPERIAGILHLTYDEQYLYIEYFRTAYRLCLGNGVLEKQAGGSWTENVYFNEAMAVYHLFYYTKDLPRNSGKWVPSHTIDGVVSRNLADDPLLAPFEKMYTGKLDVLDKVCQKMGGVKLPAGDVSYEFEAFPQVHLRLVFWDADEDFSSQAQVLVDQCVTDYLHYETVGCLISDLLEKLAKEIVNEEE